MYTTNSKSGTTTSLKCNDCKDCVKGKQRIQLSHQAQSKGWKLVSAAVHYCPKHRGNHKGSKATSTKPVAMNVKPSKAGKNGRPSIMAQMKAAHGAGATRKTAK